VEIRPGEGVLDVELGMLRVAVEELLGPPDAVVGDSAFYEQPGPRLVLRFSPDGALELIEVPYSGAGDEVTLRGVQLTFRPLDDVLADLRVAGVVGRTSDIGVDFPEGFAIWSMGSLGPSDIDPKAADDERLIVEGVSVGRPEYFGF